MPSIDTLVIGAGQAGLAVSRCLTDAAVDHVVLERGRLGERWRSERWDSLRLLTPNWASRLPGWQYDGDDPHAFMTAPEVVGYFERYAASFGAPIHDDTPVRALRHTGDDFVVRTEDRTWHADHVVIATGWCDQPFVPEAATGLPTTIDQLTPSGYRSPDQLADGGVLVVGASASGVQIADELAGAGRDVVLAVGRHSRLPRRYRGFDTWWWMDQLGTFAKRIDQVSDPRRAQREGSLQLVGRPDHRDVDLPVLAARGVRLAGRFVGSDGGRARFAPDLRVTTTAADQRLQRMLTEIDRHIAANEVDAEAAPTNRTLPTVDTDGLPHVELHRSGITSVVWATGFKRSYAWLQVPVLDADGEIRHHRGVTPVPGLYVLGQRFQYRRDSNFIDGVRHDAAYVTDHIVHRQDRLVRLAS